MEHVIERVQNHTVHPVTGFVESNAYPYAFDSDRKTDFLRIYKSNGLSFYKTCTAMQLHHSTVNKAVKTDPAFKAAIDQAQTEYIDALEAKSRDIALTNDKATLERIFQLKALVPAKYAGYVKDQGTNAITFNITGDLVMDLKRRNTVVDTTLSDDESAQIHSQSTIPPSSVHSSGEESTGAASSERGEGAGA